MVGSLTAYTAVRLAMFAAGHSWVSCVAVQLVSKYDMVGAVTPTECSSADISCLRVCERPFMPEWELCDSVSSADADRRLRAPTLQAQDKIKVKTAINNVHDTCGGGSMQRLCVLRVVTSLTNAFLCLKGQGNKSAVETAFDSARETCEGFSVPAKFLSPDSVLFHSADR